MKRVIIPLVEGQGDVAAVPVLLRKLLKASGHYGWQPGPPMRVGGLLKLRQNLARTAEALRIKLRAGEGHAVLVLLDLDRDGCPRAEALALAAELAAFGLPGPVAVVLAYREYEEWLVASLPSIAPTTPLLPDALRRDYPAESKPGVKEWLTRQMPAGFIYRETIHQEAFSQHLSPELARECRSFQRLEHAIEELLLLPATPGWSSPRALLS